MNDVKQSNAQALRQMLSFRSSGLLLALIILGAGLSISTSTFLTPYNIGIVLRQTSFVALVALGETFVLLTGKIDLSVGSTAGLSAILGALLMTALEVDPFVSLVLAMLIGLLLGLINGVLIAKVKLNFFIVTLAMGEVSAGLILVITRGYPVLGLPESFLVLGQGMAGPFPVPVIIMAVIALILGYILKNTPYGRNIYAVGGNENAARLVGIRVDRIQMSVYGLSGMLAALAGMLLVSRFGAGQPTIGATWLLPAISAAIIGGTTLTGGEGTVLGTIVGAIFMGVIANGIVLLSISAYWERVIIGSVIILAVFVDLVRNQRKRVI